MKKFSMLLIALLAMALITPATWAQMSTVKGIAKDDQGKPIVGASVGLVSKETGRKYEFKTDKSGHYFSIGVASGSYDFTLSQNGQVLTKLTGVPVKMGEDNVIDFDMAKEKTVQQQQMTPEQKAQMEQAQKAQQENVKIKGLNEKLAAAKAASDAGNFDQAVQILTEATQADPTRDLLWFKLGDAQRAAAAKAPDAAAKKAGFEGSLASYKKALELAGNLKPDLVGATYNNMGEAYAKTGQTDEAIKAYEQAVQSDPTRAGQYYFNEGAVLTNTGKADEAVKAFDKALQADPNRADAYYWKGVNLMAHATLKGNKMEAPEGTAEAFNKYLELQPTGPMAQPAKDMLASMGAEVQTGFKAAKGTKKK
jgi:tetratricopeptide (TPR) repeat protein